MQTLDKTSDKLTLVEVERESDSVNTRYTCNVEVELAGDSIWDCELERVTITDICVSDSYEDDGEWICRHIGVCYTVDGVDGAEVEDSWRMYTDSGFEEAVSELLGFEVSFTEQGMQDDGYASME
jgi:hypothetical protein